MNKPEYFGFDLSFFKSPFCRAEGLCQQTAISQQPTAKNRWLSPLCVQCSVVHCNYVNNNNVEAAVILLGVN